MLFDPQHSIINLYFFFPVRAFVLFVANKHSKGRPKHEIDFQIFLLILEKTETEIFSLIILPSFI
jgi:hypothetical protein